MAKFHFKNFRFAGCSVVLGEDERLIDNEPEYYNHDPELLNRLKNMIGLGRRYVARAGTTTSDLCLQASRSLMGRMGLGADDLDALIFVTQTPDFYMPGNAHVLHAALGLGRDCMAMDAVFGCSGYVFGLLQAAMTVAAGAKRVLLVTGDTLSRAVNAKDRSSAPLFGDAGSATILEFSEHAGETFFVMHSDGTGLNTMWIPAGAYREPSSEATRREEDFGDGGIRTREDFWMDGFSVFEFTMTEQPALLREVLEYSGSTVDGVDYFLFHQANSYIVKTISRAAKIPPGKAPSDVFTRYGNQNSASLPGVLCGALADKLPGANVQALFQGFGTGLSWGACILPLHDIVCLRPERHGAPGVDERDGAFRMEERI